MSSREDAVLNMQISLIPLLADSWKVSISQLSELFKQYDVLGYIDTCYEMFNSTGNQGIIDEIEEYIEIQGGTVR